MYLLCYQLVFEPLYRKFICISVLLIYIVAGTGVENTATPAVPTAAAGTLTVSLLCYQLVCELLIVNVASPVGPVTKDSLSKCRTPATFLAALGMEANVLEVDEMLKTVDFGARGKKERATVNQLLFHFVACQLQAPH